MGESPFFRRRCDVLGPQFREFITQFLESKSENIESLPFFHPLREAGEKNSAHFTFMVDFLRSIFPNEEIRKLAALEWEMVGHRMTPIAIGPVPSLSFVAMGNSPDDLKPVVLVPMKWHEMCEANPSYQMGAVLFVGSQIRDYYNGKILETEIVKKRSWAYEAEYLNQLMDVFPFEPDAYQQHVLDDFPHGLASLPPGVQYESKPWEEGPVSGLWTAPIDPTNN